MVRISVASYIAVSQVLPFFYLLAFNDDGYDAPGLGMIWLTTYLSSYS